MSALSIGPVGGTVKGGWLQVRVDLGHGTVEFVLRHDEAAEWASYLNEKSREAAKAHESARRAFAARQKRVAR